MALKFTGKDVTGAVLFAPTPSTPNGGDWRETNSVDHKTTEKLYSQAIANGTAGFALCGTAGENAGLLWEEKLAYVKTVVETSKKKAYVFAGCTALGTKETIRQMRTMKDTGAEGCFVGLPLWQTPTQQNMNDWWKDLGEAVPDMPIMVYSNSNFFKTSFPVSFWQGINQYGSTVVTNKVSYKSNDFAKDMDAAGPRIQFLFPMGRAIDVARQNPGRLRGLWSHDPIIMPNLVKAYFVDKDADRVGEIETDLKTLQSPNTAMPPPPAHIEENQWTKDIESQFAHYNAQQVRVQWNEVKTYPNVGPMRPPYRDVLDSIKQAAVERGPKVDKLNRKYGVHLVEAK